MRKVFIETLIKLAERDKDIYLLTGDLGFSVLEPFMEKFPRRFINCGVAEQNMVGVAAGMALCGKKPYVYSIVPFVTMRCFEQIRNDVCYQNLNVKIVGIGGGFSYGPLGATHHALEDIAILRALPNINVLCPSDDWETKELVRASYRSRKPSYFRLFSKSEPIYKKKPKIEIGKPSVVRPGKDGLIVSHGVETAFCLEIAGELAQKGKNFKVVSLHTLKPINKKELLKEIKGIKNIFTIEEHSVIGGLGGALSEVLAESDWQGKFRIIGVPDIFPSCAGKMDYLKKLYSLDKESIVKNILKEIKK